MHENMLCIFLLLINSTNAQVKVLNQENVILCWCIMDRVAAMIEWLSVFTT